MRPLIEGLVCTVKPFQVILKHFKRSQLFVHPGASFDGFDAHSSMGTKETCSQMVLQNDRGILLDYGGFGDSTMSTLALLACKFSN
jgi:hypothetical protein